jgi:hypothetical protein
MSGAAGRSIDRPGAQNYSESGRMVVDLIAPASINDMASDDNCGEPHDQRANDIRQGS